MNALPIDERGWSYTARVHGNTVRDLAQDYLSIRRMHTSNIMGDSISSLGFLREI